MESFKKIKFELSSSNEFEIVNGLVVPKGSKVFSGIAKVSVPSNEEATKSFKHLFGIRKRTKIVEEEEVEVPVKKDEESEEEVISEESEDETEEEVFDDDD